MFPYLTIVLIFFQINLLVLVLGDPLVQLPTGQILGREAITLENNTFYAFEGIPFVAPPVGSLRFKAPQPPNSWDGILNTTSFTTMCFQTSSDSDLESEDCLYLNVYTPQLPNENSNVSFNVVFYIYGGGFTEGYSQPLTPDLLINHDIILVTFNYRVGIFGFLSTQDEIIPGNHGLKDQQHALRWTHQNIHLFGGDPNKITIMGQSAGGGSVAFQIANQDNKGLFQGAILQSGNFLIPCALQRNARNIAFDTAARLNSDFQTNNDSQALLEYLQTVDAKKLDEAGRDSYTIGSDAENYQLFQGFVWAPVIEVKNEDAFLTKKMYGLLQAGNIVTVPVLIGVNSEESLLFFSNPDDLQTLMEAYDDHVEWLVPKDMHILDNTSRTTMGESIRDIYTEGLALADNLGDAIRFSSDNSFNRPSIKFAEMFSKFAHVYFYQFSYDGPLGQKDTHYDGADSVGHGEELFYLFCYYMSCDISRYPESDRLTRERMLSLWTNFVKYQNPTPGTTELLQNVTWPPVNTEDGNFYYLDIAEDLEVKNHPKEETYKAWSALYDSLDYDDFDTY